MGALDYTRTGCEKQKKQYIVGSTGAFCSFTSKADENE